MPKKVTLPTCKYSSSTVKMGMLVSMSSNSNWPPLLLLLLLLLDVPLLGVAKNDSGEAGVEGRLAEGEEREKAPPLLAATPLPLV